MNEILVTTKQNTYKVVIQKDWDKLMHYLINVLSPKKKILVITDSNVGKLYLEEVQSILEKQYQVSTYIVPSGEKTKSIDMYNSCITEAIKFKLDRESAVIALGGGVVGDLAGFVAATYMRGIKFVQLPTTLLAHDSSVGGKVAINHPLGKNLIGSFHQPSLVYYNISSLNTLDEQEIRSGYAELVKHAIIADSELFWYLMQNNLDIKYMLTNSNISEYLFKAISIKKYIVEHDERESNIRAYLNLGHTLGHAIEASSDFGKLTHGEAVAIGILFAFQLSNNKLGNNLPIVELINHFKLLNYPITLQHFDVNKLVGYMLIDKKNTNDKITFALPTKIGEMTLSSFDINEIVAELIKFKTSF
ncbi:MAG: 3-dehydroquinate synthase [Bacillales bacterium]|jgi:3-dehydroquinate synthase|nr:3-dehydroquinate synthase [Bacillales bacterium]